MRNPQSWRNVALVLAASGIGIAAFRWSQPAGVASIDAQINAMVYAMFSIPCGLAAAFMLHKQVRAQRALRSGADLIARWRVLAPVWRQFLALSKDFDFYNEIAPRKQVPRNGIEIIASKRAIMVDGDIVMVDGLTRVTQARLNAGAPTCVDLDLLTQSRRGGIRTRMVFPVPDAALGQAQVLVDCFNGMELAHLDHVYGPAGKRVVGWGLIVLGFLAAAGFGLAFWYMMPSLLQPGVNVGGFRFDGTADQAKTAMVVFGAFIAAFLGAMLVGGFILASAKNLRKDRGHEKR